MARRLSILGSTGSVGRSTLDVVAGHVDRLVVAALAAGRNIPLLEAQARRWRPELIVAARDADRSRLEPLAAELGAALACGDEGLVAAATLPGADTVVSALPGGAGMVPTMAAVEQGRRVALANKESLVMAGELLLAAARRTGAEIIPLDSEHSALEQCLRGRRPEEVRRLVLTASGGPFRGFHRRQLEQVTPGEALAHPTWAMGPKISIDSATLVNKGLELIEACCLFDMPPERVEVVVHPQSLVHALVTFVDGASLAQFAPPDMKLPIRRALSFPETWGPPFDPPLDLQRCGPITFDPVDHGTFPSITLARQALAAGGTAPAAYSAANEAAVAAFLEGRIAFPRIWGLITAVLERQNIVPADSLEVVQAAADEARRRVAALTEGVAER